MDVTREGAIGVDIDRWGVKRPNHAVGHRRSEPFAGLTTDEFAEAEPVARIASVRSPSCAAWSMSASESLSRTATDEAAAEGRIGSVRCYADRSG